MIKRWKVSAEVNLDASHYETVIIKANTQRKAVIYAIEKLKGKGFFHITNIGCKELGKGDA